MNIASLIQRDPYLVDFNRVFHRLEYNTESGHDSIELLFIIDEHTRIVVRLNYVDRDSVQSFIDNNKSASVVHIQIGRTKAHYRTILFSRLSTYYGIDDSTLQTLSNIEGSPLHALIEIIGSKLGRKLTTEHFLNPGCLIEPAELSLYREDIYEVYSCLRLVIETLTSAASGASR